MHVSIVAGTMTAEEENAAEAGATGGDLVLRMIWSNSALSG